MKPTIGPQTLTVFPEGDYGVDEMVRVSDSDRGVCVHLVDPTSYAKPTLCFITFAELEHVEMLAIALSNQAQEVRRARRDANQPRLGGVA